MAEILVLYYSPGGTTAELGNIIARGVESVDGMQARVRTVPPVQSITDTGQNLPDEDISAAYASHDDLLECQGLVMGCPTHFGNMPAALKHFLDGTSSLWLAGKLAGKPAGVFSASVSLHGGQESTLLTMMLPLLHHGMLIVGLPYTETDVFTTTSGGTPYGATRITHDDKIDTLSPEEKNLAMALGKRVANTAKRLNK